MFKENIYLMQRCNVGVKKAIDVLQALRDMLKQQTPLHDSCLSDLIILLNKYGSEGI